jgi:hypothetical protein
LSAVRRAKSSKAAEMLDFSRVRTPMTSVLLTNTGARTAFPRAGIQFPRVEIEFPHAEIEF